MNEGCYPPSTEISELLRGLRWTVPGQPPPPRPRSQGTLPLLLGWLKWIQLPGRFREPEAVLGHARGIRSELRYKGFGLGCIA